MLVSILTLRVMRGLEKIVPSVCCNSLNSCLQADILDVNQIFKDLAMMIHDQGDMIGKYIWIISLSLIQLHVLSTWIKFCSILL